MKTRQVVIVLLPGRIDLVVYEGTRRVDARRLEVDLEDDAFEWAKAVRRSAISIRGLVEELKVAGADTRVLYRSPTQSVELNSFAVNSPVQAIEAAKLSCADSLPYSAMSAVIAATVAGRDASSKLRQTHVVVAAEREDLTDAIVSLVEESGLEFVTATPLDAAVIARFVGREVAAAGSIGHGALYLGEHTSSFVVVKDGRLLFHRRIDLGLASLAGSLTRPIIRTGHEEVIELNVEDARRMLRKHGIPDRDQIVSEALGLTGLQVIPLLQPVLQRFVVELRQSLRFGIDEDDRSNLAIRLTGPGASIPGLAELFGQELGIEMTVDPAFGDTEPWWEPGPRIGELHDALESSRFLDRINLLPKELASRRRLGVLRRWLWTGAAAAIAVIAVDGVRHHLRLLETRDQADVYAGQLADLEALQGKGERLSVVMSAMSDLERSIGTEIGTRVNYRACMQELTRVTPETVRFDSIRFSRQNEKTVGTVTGCAFDTADGAGRTELEPFMECLRSSPLFDAVVLGNVHKGTMGMNAGQVFEATFVAVPVPHRRRAVPQAAAAETGDEP